MRGVVVMCVCSLPLWCWVDKTIERVAHVAHFILHPTHSVDQEEAAFDDYFKQMPWLALPFDGEEREQFMSTYQVRLSGATDKTNTHPNERGGRKGDWLMHMDGCRHPPPDPPPHTQIKSIPRLIIFAADGRVLEENAVGPRFLNDQAFDAWSRGQPAAAATAGHSHAGGGGGCCGGGGCK